jgi:hypothetical protein
MNGNECARRILNKILQEFDQREIPQKLLWSDLSPVLKMGTIINFSLFFIRDYKFIYL